MGTKLPNAACKIYEIVIDGAVQLADGSWTLHTNRGVYQTKPGAAINQRILDFADQELPEDWVIGNPDYTPLILFAEADDERHSVWGIQRQQDGKILR